MRLRVQGELITLIPVEVSPRVDPRGEEARLVLGTFYLDADRAAVARARFGFAGTDGGFPRVLGRVETFLELENALWEGRFWLPFRQRREIVFNSKALGGSVVARVVNRFVDLDLNTDWSPSGRRVQLTWSADDSAFAGWEGEVGEEAAEYSFSDFADLRLATAMQARGGDSYRVRLHYAQGSHLFRYGPGGGAVPGDRGPPRPAGAAARPLVGLWDGGVGVRGVHGARRAERPLGDGRVPRLPPPKRPPTGGSRPPPTGG